MVPGRRFEDLSPAGGPVRGADLRLFFALWPDETLRARLAAAAELPARQSGGRPVPPGNYHLTLAFLGRVPGQDLGALIQVGGQVRGEPVALYFDQVEYWPRPRVLVALASERPATGPALVDQLWDRLEPQGFARETRPWQPHLTLARRVSRRPEPALALDNAGKPGLRAEFAQIALVESMSAPRGARYRPIAEWPLGRGLSHPTA